MSSDSLPTRNPANDGELAGTFAEILNKFLLGNIDDMLPAIIEEYDKEKNRVRVRPAVKVISQHASGLVATTRDPVASIPVFQLGGGGYMLAFNNLKKGDLGWIKASDRDISLFLQSYNDAEPNTRRLHKFEDALFFPDIMRGYDIVDGEHAVLQSTDGQVKIALKDDSIEIIAGTVNIGPQVNLGTGGAAIARVGDPVTVTIVGGSSAGPASGTITAGSANHTAN